MNIFERMDSIFGCLDSGARENSLLSLFKLAKQIQLLLGKQGYLLDSYLSLFFEAVSDKYAFEAADAGVLEGGEIQSLLYEVMNGSEPTKQYPFYQRIQQVYEQQLGEISFQEYYTKLCLLLFPLADEIMVHCTSKFVDERVNHLNGTVDMIRFGELYNQISHLVDQSLMAELNQRLRQRFMIAPLSRSYAQGLTDDLLSRLTARDHETSRQMFQLLLDSMPNENEREGI